MVVFFFKQKTAYEMRISDWSSDVCSSDLDRLAHLVEVGVEWNADLDLDPHPVAAVIGDVAHLAEGDGVQRAIVMSELDRTQGDLLDHALATGTLDVLAFAERVLHQIEEPRDDVLHQGLSAEADGERSEEHTSELQSLMRIPY